MMQMARFDGRGERLGSRAWRLAPPLLPHAIALRPGLAPRAPRARACYASVGDGGAAAAIAVARYDWSCER
jgi:hypothetical protein